MCATEIQVVTPLAGGDTDSAVKAEKFHPITEVQKRQRGEGRRLPSCRGEVEPLGKATGASLAADLGRRDSAHLPQPGSAPRQTATGTGAPDAGPGRPKATRPTDGGWQATAQESVGGPRGTRSPQVTVRWGPQAPGRYQVPLPPSNLEGRAALAGLKPLWGPPAFKSLPAPSS